MKGVPLITPQLKAAKGGLAVVLNAMRSSGESEIQDFLEKYDEVPVGDRERLSWEEIATAAGVETKPLLGAIMIAMRDEQQNVASIMSMSAHPEILAKRIKFAMKEGGVRDRDAIDTHLGYLPTKSGSVINNRIQLANLQNGVPDGEVAREVEVGPELEMTDTMLPGLQDIRQHVIEGRK